MALLGFGIGILDDVADLPIAGRLAVDEARWSLGDRLLRYDPERAIRGDDVISLQERLHELGYDAGPVDGVFGVDTENMFGCWDWWGAATAWGAPSA